MFGDGFRFSLKGRNQTVDRYFMKFVLPFYRLTIDEVALLSFSEKKETCLVCSSFFSVLLSTFLLSSFLLSGSLQPLYPSGTDPVSPATNQTSVQLFTDEVCDNGLDDDGDGLVDCEDPDCGGAANCLSGNLCAALGDNLVLNGDFEQGYFAFSSDFGRGSNHAVSGECEDQGWFAVGRPTSIQNLVYAVGPGDPGSFTSSDPTDQSNTAVLPGNGADHTHGDGNFLVADPNNVVDAAIWYQDLVLCAGQKYIFSAWIKNLGLTSEPSPRLTLVIDGEQLTSFTEMKKREWEEISVEYIANHSGVVRVAIVNGGGCEGNDLAIDDISLKPCSSNKVEIAGPEVICVGEDVSLSVSSLDSTIVTPEFQWQRSEDGGQSWIDIPGEYYPFLVYSKPISKTQFRLLASDQGSINIPSCRFVSNVIEPEVLNCVAEICNNGLDDDKDGEIDEEDADCPAGDVLVCSEGAGIKYYLPAVWQNNRRGYPHSLFISTAFAVANVNIRTADGTFNQDISISSNAPGEITLPKNVVASKNINTIESNRGLIITSDVPISPLYRITNRFNRMLANLKGNGALGRNFRLATPVRAGGDARMEERHFFSVMATADSTVVTIDECPFPLEGITLPFSTTLSAGETILFYPAKVNHHITGTLVVADKPISVMAGTQHTVGNGTWNREAAGDVAIPFTKLGQHYVCIRGGFSSSLHDYAIVMAVMDGTQVYMDGDPMPVANLAAGEYTLIEITGNKGDPHYIRSTKNVYVYHVSGNMPTARQMGEFGMAVLPPINSQACTGIKSTAIPKFLEGGTLNDLYIIAPDDALASLQVDGQSYKNFGTEKRVPGYKGYSSIYLDQNTLANNINFIKSDNYVYVGQLVGLRGTGAYGYYSDYDSRVDVIDPDQSLPTTYYVVDTVCMGSTIIHELQVESCGNTHKIISGIQGKGTISFAANSLRLSYTAEELGLDVIQVTVENENGFKGNVCLGFYVQQAEANAGPDQVVCYGETVQLRGTGGQTFEWTPSIGMSSSELSNPMLSPESTMDFQLEVTDAQGCTDVDSVRIMVNAPPELMPIVARLCEDDAQGIDLRKYSDLIDVRGVGGNFTFYDEDWKEIDSPERYDPVDGEVINVLLADGGTACSDTGAFSFSIQPSIVIPSQVIEICKEDAESVDLTRYEAAIGNKKGVFTYFNEAGDTIAYPQLIRVTDGEFIRVHFTSDLCEATANYTFSFRTPPTAFAGNDTSICPGTSLALNGRGGVELSWRPNPTLSDTSVANPLVSPQSRNAYYLEVMDQYGCVNQDTIIVGLHMVTEASTVLESSLCQGDSVQLYASGGVAYSWNNVLSLSDPTVPNPVASPGITTLYMVEITDANGCKREDSVMVRVKPVPKANAGEDVAICKGESVRLSGSRGDSYSWAPSRGLSKTSVSSPLFSGEETTTYTLTVMNNEGCIATDSMRVVVNPLPKTSINVSETEVCKDEEVVFEASGADYYRWMPEGEFPNSRGERNTINPLASSLYVLEGRTNEGCYAWDSTHIILHNGANPLVTKDTSACEGDTLWLGVSGASSYLWSTEEQVDTILTAPDEPTAYWVIPYTNLGCPGDTAYSFVQTYPYPIAMFNPDADSGYIPIEIFFYNDSEFADSYLWDFGDGTTSREETPRHEYTEVGKYTVNLIAFNEIGCQDSISFSYLDILSARVFGGNAFTPNGDGKNDVFRFMAMGVERMTMQVFNRGGNLVYEETGKEPKWDGTSNGVRVPNGIYVYRLQILEEKGYSYTKVGTIMVL